MSGTADDWPQVDAGRVTEEAALFVLAQAETALQAQLDIADKQLARLTNLMTVCASLAAAAVSLGFAALPRTGVEAWPAAVYAPALFAAAAIWLSGAALAAAALQDVALAGPGKSPRDLYGTEELASGRLGLALFMIRVTGSAFEGNIRPMARIALRLRSVAVCLRFAPVPGAAACVAAALGLLG